VLALTLRPVMLLLYCACRYQGPRSVEALTTFATMGYQTVKSTPIAPQSPGFTLPSTSELKEDVTALLKGKLPDAQNRLIVLVGGGLLALAAVAVLLTGLKKSLAPPRKTVHKVQ
jgi:hypothetical protein